MSKRAANQRPQGRADCLLSANFRADTERSADRVFPEEETDSAHLRWSRHRLPILRASQFRPLLLKVSLNREVPGWSQGSDRRSRATGGKQQRFAQENRIASIIGWQSSAPSLEPY